MKRLLNSAVILIGLTLIAGCTMEPDAPRLISPKDGSVFDTVPPTFTWSPEENAEGYVLEVIDDTNGLIGTMGLDHLWMNTNDSTYTLTETEYGYFNDTAYFWHVASFWLEKGDTLYAWSEWRSFVIDKPLEPGDPLPPILISPENGAVFDTLPPTFIWNSDSLSQAYLFRIWTDSTTEVEDSLGDTTYAMSKESFDDLAEGSYSWAAATVSASGKKFWSETRAFTINRPEPVTDLDTTYFPLGLSYEWCFERYAHSEGDDGEGQTWNFARYDTFTVRIIDSISLGDTAIYIFFESTRNLLQIPDYMPYCLWEFYEEAKVYADSVYTVIWGMVGLLPDPATLPGFVSYEEETLLLKYHSWSPNLEDNIDIRNRVGIGTVSQIYNHYYYGDVPPYPYEEQYENDRLLYFYNGRDTVYKAAN